MEPSLYIGPDLIILEGGDLVIGGPGRLDAYNFKVQTEAANWKDRLSDAGIEVNGRLDNPEFHSMWVSEIRLEGISGSRAVASVSCLGLVEDSTKRKDVFSDSVQRVSTPSDGSASWSLAVGKPAVQSTWFATARPVGDGAGTAVTQIETYFPEPADFSGGSYAWLEFRKNYPEGWVVEAMNIEQIFVHPRDSQSGLWAVTRNIAWYPTQTPM